jgi:hypothetical protein
MGIIPLKRVINHEIQCYYHSLNDVRLHFKATSIQ